MSQRPTIHGGKLPVRFHYIAEWAERRELRQKDVAAELEVDKGTVSRWFDGVLPTPKHLLALAGLFGLDEPAELFRHPDDDWLASFMKGREVAEQKRIRDTLEAAFPKKVA